MKELPASVSARVHLIVRCPMLAFHTDNRIKIMYMLLQPAHLRKGARLAKYGGRSRDVQRNTLMVYKKEKITRTQPYLANTFGAPSIQLTQHGRNDKPSSLDLLPRPVSVSHGNPSTRRGFVHRMPVDGSENLRRRHLLLDPEDACQGSVGHCQGETEGRC